MPNSVDFPDPFSRASTVDLARFAVQDDTCESACTVPKRFDTPRSDNTRGLSGPGLDISL